MAGQRAVPLAQLSPGRASCRMDALLSSTFAVSIAEIGDKTQLLALLLAARYRQPVPIIAGILLATLANHAAAALAGVWIDYLVGPTIMRWAVGLSFLAVAVWTLIPDKLDDGDTPRMKHAGPLLATLVCFFLVEMGDKTQIATVVLAARFDSLLAVVLGTTAGMLVANAPVVFFGDGIAKRLPLHLIRLGAAALFAIMGLVALIDPGLTDGSVSP